MKNILLFAILWVITITGMQAQVAVPKGIRYQAIARDNDGRIRSNESLVVKAELVLLEPVEDIVYSEIHNSTSGEFGLLNFTVGEGNVIKGSFSDVPWEKQVWIRISIKNADNDDYQLITTSKLYSVPYAFYAESAGSLIDNQSDHTGDHGRGLGGDLDQTSVYWTLDGNTNAHNYKTGGPAVLGTTDRTDLNFITNNLLRMVIDKQGNIHFLTNTSLSGNLNVDGNTTLNGSLDVTGMHPTHLSGTLTVDKSTTLNDSLTVKNMAPTHLTGKLDVDKTLTVNGATTLNNTLDVTNMSATHLTGTLTVDKATTLNSTVTVANMAATNLTGALDVDKTLNVDGATTMNSTLDVNNMSATHLTGTLTVDKASTLKGAVTVTNSAPTHLTGLLNVDGTFDVTGKTTLNGTLEVAGTNATHLTGTLEVGKLATMKAGMVVTGQGTLGPNGDHVAFFDNTEGGNSDGIAIRIQNNNTTAENNFVTFYKGDNSVAGRIEGYVLNDILSPPVPTHDEIWTAICIALADYNPITIFWTQFATYFNLTGTLWNAATIPGFPLPDFPGLTLPDFPGLTLPNFPGLTLPDIPSVSIDGVGTVFPGLGIPDIPSFDIPDIPAFTIPDIPPFTIPDVPTIDLSADLFTWPTIPTFSDILQSQGICPNAGIFDVPNGYVYRLIQWGVQNDMQNMISFSPIDLAAKIATWTVTKVVKSGGVTYGSQGADYAEYLPKLYPTEQFLQGEIVGVHGGSISKVTNGADQILAISTNPMVLGNEPADSIKNGFEKVGFLGQVPVFVQGPVQLGDYIIPSGKNDGIGKAIKPSELTADVLPLIFGKAWSDSPLETTVAINVSVGLRPTEIAEVLKQRESTLKSLQDQINSQESIHQSLKEEVNMLKEYLDIDTNAPKPKSN